MIGTVLIVAMRTEHIDELMPYEQAMFGTEAWSADSYRDELADTRHRRYLAALDQDGNLIGWAGVRVVAGEAEILTVGVIPAARRQGIAVRLLSALLHEARQRGATQAFLEVRVDNIGARRMYERAGFVRVGIRRGYYDAGRVDAVVMRLDLPPRGTP
ncbi:MAG: ribosomal protein S18-alanine N-acetyltransferase [Actinomycetota bacterium]